MAVTMNFYDQFVELMGDGTIDLDNVTNTFAIMLMNSSHVFTASHTLRTDVSANQIATGNGYTQATGGGTGKMLASITWAQTSGTAKWDAADVQWTASGGDIGPADDAVIFYDPATSPADALVMSIDFGGSQTAGDTTTFNINWSASGIFTVGP